MGFGVASRRPRKQSKEFYSRLEIASIQMQIKGKMGFLGPWVLTAPQLQLTWPQQIILFFSLSCFSPVMTDNSQKDWYNILDLAVN